VALGVLVVLAALLGTAGVLRQLRPAVEEFPAGDRVTYYLRHADDYDVLFVGTSRVYRNVIPGEFDSRLAEHGIEVRSFNLGAPGMRAFETDRMLRYLLRRRAPRLRWVVVERGDSDPRPRSWEERTERAVAWHTARQTVAAVAASWRLDLPRSEKAALVASHGRQFLRRLLNYGAGPALVRGLERSRLPLEDWGATAGYRGLEEEGSRVHRGRRRQFLRQVDSFRRTVAENRRRQRPLGDLAEASLAALVEQGGLVRAAGPEPILLIGPNDGRLRGLELAAVDLELLNFDDPVRYPQLFDVELRYDSSHLTTAGSRLYSRLLADEVAARFGGR
jgi:hypothetical protein